MILKNQPKLLQTNTERIYSIGGSGISGELTPGSLKKKNENIVFLCVQIFKVGNRLYLLPQPE